MAEKKQIKQKATSEELSSGVVLFAFGKTAYYWATFNLAFSIKYHNPNINIAIFTDDPDSLRGAVYNCDYFDSISQIDINDLSTDKRFDPAKLKLSLYKYLPFDYNLYLDVDAIALKDLQPMINELIGANKYYVTHTVGYHTIKQGRDIPTMQWAWADDIWKQYNLSDKAILPAINSSMQFIVKSKEAELLYKTAFELFQNPIPVNKLRMRWGNGQPDELYMNIALAVTKHDPGFKNDGRVGKSESGFIHFAMRRSLTYEEVIENFYLQSYYGGVRFTPLFYTEWIDRILRRDLSKVGITHEFFIEKITKYKHADNKK
jgi:hypothetical protein